MSNYFICPTCGHMFEYKVEPIGKPKYICECGHKIVMEYSYPTLNIADLCQSADLLFESSRLQELQIRKQVEDCFKNFYIIEDDETKKKLRKDIDIAIDTREKIRKSLPDNEDETLKRGSEKLEESLEYSLIGYNGFERDDIQSAVEVFCRNKWRKPLIILIATILEQSFHAYHEEWVKIKYNMPKERQEYLRHLSPNIPEKIKILQSKSTIFKSSTAKHKDFFDSWDKLRKIRNGIVHNKNRVYVTQSEAEFYYPLIEKGIDIFAKLNSELIGYVYKNKTSFQ